MMRCLPLLLLACGPQGPVLSDLSASFDDRLPTVLTISASVDPPSVMELRMGPAADQLDTVLESGSSADHSWTLAGLAQGSTLHFEVWAIDADGVQVRAPAGQVTAPQLGLPDLVVQVSDATRSELVNQQVLVSLVTEQVSGLAAYDFEGKAVWGYQAAGDRTLAWPTVDGEDVLVLDVFRDRMQDDTRMQRIPMRGGPWTETRMETGHHGYALLPDGDVAWLGLSFWDQDVTALDVDEEQWRVYGDTVWRAPEAAGESGSLLFSYEEDYPHPFFLPCPHPLLEEDRLGEEGVHEWTHNNSVAFVPEWNALLTGSRLHDSIVALDADTGAWLWQAGGADGWPVDDPWSHGHFSDAWEGGLLMFDNGLEKERAVSRVVELSIDPDTQTVQTTWEFEQPDEGLTTWLGDAKRLPGGNVLMAYTELGLVVEVTREGEVVWQAQAAGWNVGRVAPVVLGP